MLTDNFFLNLQKEKYSVFLIIDLKCQVEIEDHPYLTKSEGVNTIPAFKIYKNGSRVKEISGNNHELLERSVKLYSS